MELASAPLSTLSDGLFLALQGLGLAILINSGTGASPTSSFWGVRATTPFSQIKFHLQNPGLGSLRYEMCSVYIFSLFF